ncbi:MAG: FtsX-like permease family protein [Candidatus Abyssobacteria bacterium SURF_5]|uniref:FtsX-like permease family protein n=1 Tax=Abyssobacteria bacterium (strain SURF_5) TaxID=2093360 RepID=A0A3A4NV94_ABYX5|nr:MAG: FtsX-like permease family protein [Candidatus Abyssubacteria bacterium SURF_5]
MFFWESIIQAWYSLKGHKLRTGLTMFGIIWGIASMIILVGMGRSSQKLFYREFEKIGERLIFVWAGKSSSGLSGIKGGRQIRFTIEDVEALKNHCPDVEMVTPQVRAGYREVKRDSEVLSCETYGLNADANIIRNLIVEEGRFIVSDDVTSGRRVCVLGANVKEKLFGDQPAVGESIRLSGIIFHVIGTLVKKGDQLSRPSTLDDDQVSIPYTTAQDLLIGSPYFYSICVRPVSLLNEKAAREQITAALAVRHGFDSSDSNALHIFGTTDMIARVKGATIGLQIFLGAASIITLFIGGVGVMNIMFVSINERVREIGIIKAVGARNRQVFLQFLIESLFITFFAGSVGALGGCSICLVLGLFKMPRFVAPPEIDPAVVAVSLSVMIVVGVLSGILPALRASRMQIIEALRSH